MASGLDGVVVADTVLSEVDGAAGRLVVRGAPIEALTGRVSFAAMAARLWDGLSPVEETEAGVLAALGAARLDAHARLGPGLAAARALPPLEGLRLLVASLPADGAQPAHHRLTGALPVFLAALLHAGSPVAPDAQRDPATDFLRMATGTTPAPALTAALEAYLVTVAEHGMNASTFTARVIASTRAGAVAAVVGALGALQGPLHGGAPGPVLDMLDAIGTAEAAPAWIAAQLDAGERLMGFGHRIYRVRDPRADVLAGVLTALPGWQAHAGGRLALARAVEREALAQLAARKPDRPLRTNVEFYTALLLEAVGVPRAAFTAAFALGRVAGWTAHVLEQERDGRLIRPQSRYVGTVAMAV